MNTLYINRLTTVDCALLIGNKLATHNANSQILGFSFNVSCKISGKVDPVENVIVDFGALKKTLKAEIDNLEYGYDHKLIAGNDYDDVVADIDNTSGTASIIDFSNNTLFSGPANAIRKVSSPSLSAALDDLYIDEVQSYFLSSDKFQNYVRTPYKGLLIKPLLNVINGLEEELMGFLQSRLDEIYPQAEINVDAVQCDIQPIFPMHCFDSGVANCTPAASIQMFPYTHGLKKSTSIGCKNLVHGHLSSIVAISMVDATRGEEAVRKDIIAVQGLINYITLEHFNAHFVWSENTDSSGSTESYVAEGRGEFQMELNSGESVSLVDKSILLDSESTIENLTTYMADKYGEALRDLGVSVIYVSEGLSKGSYVDVKSL